MADRLDSLRKKLAARAGVPGYEKNCEALHAEIARLEQAPAPSPEEMDAARKAAESETTSTEGSKDASA